VWSLIVGLVIINTHSSLVSVTKNLDYRLKSQSTSFPPSTDRVMKILHPFTNTYLCENEFSINCVTKYQNHLDAKADNLHLLNDCFTMTICFNDSYAINCGQYN
jgi:hypothetical protein